MLTWNATSQEALENTKGVLAMLIPGTTKASGVTASKDEAWEMVISINKKDLLDDSDAVSFTSSQGCKNPGELAHSSIFRQGCTSTSPALQAFFLILEAFNIYSSHPF